MRPTLPHRLSAVPQSWPVQAQILDAARTLLTEHGEDLRKRRRNELAEIRRDCELLAEALHTLSQELLKAGFRRDQPRWRKGSGRISGRWSGGAGLAVAGSITARLRGGHHYIPRAVFGKERLKPETRRVFEDAVTGKLAPGEHGWNSQHKAYNKAVLARWKEFLKERRITAEEMSPEQAREFVDHVKHSSNRIIRDFNAHCVAELS